MNIAENSWDWREQEPAPWPQPLANPDFKWPKNRKTINMVDRMWYYLNQGRLKDAMTRFLALHDTLPDPERRHPMVWNVSTNESNFHL